MMRQWCSFLVCGLLFCGCVASNTDPAASQPDADAGRAQTLPDYWYAQPASVSVTAGDFEAAWASADAVARQLLFTPDRVDPRSGVLTTEPLVSSQFFEPWRQDLQTAEDTARSSIALHRRTVRFEFSRLEDGRYEITPKALVERYAQAERRVTSVVLYRSAFRSGRITEETPFGTRETDRGINLPRKYWYAVGRDEALERRLAAELERKLTD